MTPSELSFDYKPHIYSMLLKSSGEQANNKTHSLEEVLARLEEERLKIDAFKRELPLCMQLLNNAMEASRLELQSQRTNQGAARPVLEEFIPLKNPSSPDATENIPGNISTDKANWMTSAQLWNQESDPGAKAASQPPLISSPQEADINLALSGKQRTNGGAFLPFSPKDRAFPELALASSHKEEMEDQKNISSETNSRSGKCGNGSSVAEKDQQQVSGTASTATAQTQRKARRCWSPDLHRRFVNALHMLGGSQELRIRKICRPPGSVVCNNSCSIVCSSSVTVHVNMATPKQIRELMKVDGLTNDEVKSHLQKYRLHTRRPSPSPQSAVTATPQVVLLGGIWVPPEYAAAAAHGGAHALYGAHAATTHQLSPAAFCSPATQEMYPGLAPPPPPPNHQLNHHQIHHQQLHLYNHSSNNINKPPLAQRNNGSPGLDHIQGGAGDPSESIEDGKSESSSWKADSGGEERRRVECEESVVSLKF